MSYLSQMYLQTTQENYLEDFMPLCRYGPQPKARTETEGIPVR